MRKFYSWKVISGFMGGGECKIMVGIDISKYKVSADYPADKILRNMIHPKLGEHILKSAYLHG